MLAHMKRHLTKIEIEGQAYILPERKKKIILSLVKEFAEDEKRLGNVPFGEVYKKEYGHTPKWAVALRGARSKENMSQKELSEKTGIPITNISKYENGERKISQEQAQKIAKVLRVGIDVFKNEDW